MEQIERTVRRPWPALLAAALSPAAALAGGLDWRWALAALPAGVVLGWLLLRRTRGNPPAGWLKWVYAGWAVVLAADTLARTAGRVRGLGAPGSGTVWLVLLMAVPFLWLAWGKDGAFFRAAGIFWLVGAVALAGAVLLVLPKFRWGWLLEPAGDGMDTALSVFRIWSVILFAIPYIYKEGEMGGSAVRLGWFGLLSVIPAALAAGVLSPMAAAQLPQPFFVAAGLLGEGVRGEGLISALWLLPDLALLGLLSRSWGGRWWGLALGGLSVLLAPVAAKNLFTPEILALGGGILALITLLWPPEKGK